LVLIPFISTLSAIIRSIDFGDTSNALQKNRDEAIQLYLNNSDFIGILKNVFLMALIPAVFEELFFRGVLQKFIYSFIKKAWPTFIIVGVIFALFHGSIYEFLPIFLGSIIISWVYHYTSSMLLCILLHFLNNGIQVILASVQLIDAGEEQTQSNEILYSYGIFAGCTIITIAILYYIFKHKSALPATWSVETIK